MNSQFAAVILAGGLSKRMGGISKVLLKIGGRTLIERTVDTLTQAGASQIIVVANQSNSKPIAKILPKEAIITVQNDAKGTLDAAVIGAQQISGKINTVAFLYGDDSAFYEPITIAKVAGAHIHSKPTITFVTLDKENPTGLGRVVRKNGKLVAIVEEKDATEEQKKIKEINDGLYFFDKRWFLNSYLKIKPSQVTNELYLTDLVEVALTAGQKVETFKLKNSSEWHGINTPEELQLAKVKYGKRIHFMGIAGSGAAAVAAIAKDNGYNVDGCDLESESAYLSNLEGITIKHGHNPQHLEGIDLLISSPAIEKLDQNNKEIEEAKKRKIPTMSWQRFQGKFLQKDKFIIAIAGGYGKSTTTAMISKILIDQHLDPTCAIGAKVLEWEKNYKVGNSIYYICEADEYNSNFLHYESDIEVLLNLAWDHPDYFKSKDELINVYRKFIGKIKKNGILIIGNDNELIETVKGSRRDIKIVKTSDYSPYNLSIIGDFRKENANIAMTLALTLGLNLKKAKESLENFEGLARRLEYKGQKGKVLFYDDYAVQPFTIKTTANALKKYYKDKVIALVLEPHTYSRIETFFEDFVTSLNNTTIDHIFITDIFAAREKEKWGNLSIKLADRLGSRATYTGSLENTAMQINKQIDTFDIVLTMGAGKVYRLWDIL